MDRNDRSGTQPDTVVRARDPEVRGRLTLKDIARMAGVSRTTASRVLNGRGEVRPEVRARVEAVIADTGYTPLASARSLVSNRTGLVGFVVPLRTAALVQDPYFVACCRGSAEARHVAGWPSRSSCSTTRATRTDWSTGSSARAASTASS